MRVIELNNQGDTVAGKVRENITLLLIKLVGPSIVVASLVEYCLRGMPVSWVWLVAGIACAILSFWIRWRAIAALGKFWSLHVEIRDNHEFVRSGPFRWMRHPAYLSMILELVAVGLVLHAPITMLVIIPFLYVPILFTRIRIEEAALIEKFGDSYRAYRKTTPALFPGTKF